MSFKGSAKGLSQIWDEATSVLFTPKTPFSAGGEVQEYFDNTFRLFDLCVSGSTESLIQKYPDFRVVITGHSLGGALASLTAASFVFNGVASTDNLFLYTFGMPRVGDKDYALAHDRLIQNSWRVVH